MLKAFVLDAMATLDVPGVGLAFIANSKVVWEGELIVCSLGSSEPVDARTNFMIASNTKSMATMSLADQGKLDWTTPVTSFYPAFRIDNDATTAASQVHHLVCACTGLPRKDLEWLFTTTAATPATDTLRQLAGTQPTSKFGEAFQYNNLLASEAGFVAGHVYNPGMELGAAFERAGAKRIWKPIGMTDSTFDFERAVASNYAAPHGSDIDGKMVVSSLGNDFNRTIKPFRLAGGAWSSPHDMIRHVGSELAEGRLPDGTQSISRKNLLERRARGVPTGKDRWYGMGLEEEPTRVSIIHHGGDLLGFHSDMMRVPAAGVGTVILTNGENGVFIRAPLLRRLLEVLYDGKPEAAADITAAAARIKIEIAEFSSRLTVPADPAGVAALAASYRNPELGTLTITRSGTKVSFDFAAWTSEKLTHRNTDGTLSFLTVAPGFRCRHRRRQAHADHPRCPA